MVQAEDNNFICAGKFRGGEVEPGVFHKACSTKSLRSVGGGKDSEVKQDGGDSDNEVDTDAESSSPNKESQE